MANDPELKVRITAELNQLKQSLSQLQNDLVKVGGTGKKAGSNAASGFDQTTKSINGAVGALKSLIAGYLTLQTGKQFIQLADQAKLLEARLKLVTSSQEELIRAQESLFQLAQRSRAPIQDTVDLYVKFAQVTKELGVNQDTLLATVESINQAVTLSGSSAESAQAALVQLGQGIASGTLRGQELNSVMEQTPRLAQAIAKGLGVSIGELRKLGEEGKITGDQIINSLLSQREVLQREFESLPVTVGQAFTQLGNSVAVAVGQIDKVTGASGGLSGILQDLSVFLDSGALQESFINTFTVWSQSIGATVKDIGVLISAINELFGGLEDEGESAVDFIVGAFRNFPTNIRAFIQIAVVEVFAMFDKMIAYASGFKDKIKAIFTDDTIDQADARMAASLEAIESARQDTIDSILAERDAHIKAGQTAVDRYRKEREAAKAVFESKDIGGGIKPIAPVVDTTKADEERAKQLKKEEEERRQLLARNATAFEQAQIRLAELEGRHLDARLKEIEIKYRDMLAGMVEAGDQAGFNLVSKLIDKEKAKAKFDAIKNDFEKVMTDLQKQEDSLANRVKVGDKSPLEADSELDAARSVASDKMGSLVDQAKVLSELYPELIPLVEELTNKMNGQAEASTGVKLAQEQVDQSLTKLVDGFASTLASGAIDGLTDAFTNIIDGTKSVKTALQDFARSMGDLIISMVARIAATMLVLQGLSAITGIPVAALAKFAGISSGVNHTGGIAGQGGTIRGGLNPLLFAGAPRYHAGGIAGLKTGEVPAILKKGEEVLTENDPRHARNGGGQGGGGSTRVINVIDPNMVADYMNTPQGEQIMVNLIQRNSGAIKQVMS